MNKSPLGLPCSSCRTALVSSQPLATPAYSVTEACPPIFSVFQVMIYNVPTGVESGHKSPKENIKTDLILPMAQEWPFSGLHLNYF